MVKGNYLLNEEGKLDGGLRGRALKFRNTHEPKFVRTQLASRDEKIQGVCLLIQRRGTEAQFSEERVMLVLRGRVFKFENFILGFKTLSGLPLFLGEVSNFTPP